jgi:hypothetical protein
LKYVGLFESLLSDKGHKTASDKGCLCSSKEKEV